MPKIYKECAKICKKYAQYTKNMQGICKKYEKNMQDICKKYARYMQKI